MPCVLLRCRFSGLRNEKHEYRKCNLKYLEPVQSSSLSEPWQIQIWIWCSKCRAGSTSHRRRRCRGRASFRDVRQLRAGNLHSLVLFSRIWFSLFPSDVIHHFSSVYGSRKALIALTRRAVPWVGHELQNGTVSNPLPLLIHLSILLYSHD